jgi:antitoxin ParD1/3/4
MNDLNISLPESMRTFVDEQVTHGGLSTASEYVCQLIRADQKRTAEKRVEALLVEGVQSGDAVPVSGAWWERKNRILHSARDIESAFGGEE